MGSNDDVGPPAVLQLWSNQAEYKKVLRKKYDELQK